MPADRSRHPKKEVEQALRRLEADGWHVTERRGGHAWGDAMSPDGEQRVHIWSTPRQPSHHARQLLRAALRAAPAAPPLAHRVADEQLGSLVRTRGVTASLPFPSFTVAADELLGARPTLLLGEPGSGKTTLLAGVTAQIQEAVLAGDARYGAVLIPARELKEGASFVDTVREWLDGRLGIQVRHAELASALRSGNLGLILDGLDELTRADRGRLSSELAATVETSAISRVVASSRVVGTDPALTTVLEPRRVPPLGRDDALALLAEVSGSILDQGVAERLYALSAGNPLMLQMLSDAYRRRGRLPATRTGLLRDAIDGLLAVLEDRVSEPRGPLLSLDVLERAYGELALVTLTEARPEIPIEQATQVLSGAGLHPELVVRLLELDARGRGGMLREGRGGTIGFRHLSIAEFMAASAVSDDPGRLGELAEHPGTHDVVATAITLSADPVDAVLRLADRPGLDTLRLSRSALSELPPSVARRVRTALIEHLDVLLGGSGAEGPPTEPQREVTDEEPDLLARWRALVASDAEGYERGLELERFMADFFGRFFEVVEHDYRTDTGQIDLLLSNTRPDPFWLNHIADMYVECKNTSRKTEQKEINDFAGKLAPGRTTLAFFVSQSGFTPPAWDRIRAAALDRGGTLIVPIKGAQIEQTLADGEEPERFFKRLVRDTSHLRIF
ncbi:MAG TPA: restriction endonuclease [Thermoleophilaceae bacterium]